MAQALTEPLDAGIGQAHDLGPAERAGRSRKQKVLRHEDQSREGEAGTLHDRINRRVQARFRQWLLLHDSGHYRLDRATNLQRRLTVKR